jgi:hypothetical protein
MSLMSNQEDSEDGGEPVCTFAPSGTRAYRQCTHILRLIYAPQRADLKDQRYREEYGEQRGRGEKKEGRASPAPTK